MQRTWVTDRYLSYNACDMRRSLTRQHSVRRVSVSRSAVSTPGGEEVSAEAVVGVGVDLQVMLMTHCCDAVALAGDTSQASWLSLPAGTASGSMVRKCCL
jgi:hypothetical protein